jgi:hypothetical protein
MDNPPITKRIGKYEVHPAAELFPLMEGKAFQDLKSSIESHGQSLPISVKGNVILDGRNRLRACLDLGIEPKVQEHTDARTPYQLITDMNLTRRDLTESQRAVISAEIYRMDMEERERAAKSEAGKSAGRGRPKQLEQKPAQAIREPQTRDKIAKDAGVSRYKAEQALKITTSPVLAAEVRTGKKDLNEAIKEMEVTEPVASLKKEEPTKEASMKRTDGGELALVVMKLAEGGKVRTTQEVCKLTGSNTAESNSSFMKRARILPWLKIERKPEGYLFKVNEKLRLQCEGHLPLPELDGAGVYEFIEQLAKEIDRRRKDNNEKGTAVNWKPDYINKLKQKELLDWIEVELSKLTKLMAPSVPDLASAQ